MTTDLIAEYGHKIVDAQKLKEHIGDFPRKDPVVICHGVFDVVHPGHIRHLLYAKKQAAQLVVSITSDRFVNKGKYRPQVPQDLRALNLAAFELVDYVVINDAETPLELIKQTQPDYFAKGFEYNKNLIKNTKTAEEQAMLVEYGGEFLFSPGDYVLSSSAIINQEKPDIGLEKLSLALAHGGIEFTDLYSVLDRFTNLSVHVVGDLIVDSFTRCSMIGGQTKTPTISVLKEKRRVLLAELELLQNILKPLAAAQHSPRFWVTMI